MLHFFETESIVWMSYLRLNLTWNVNFTERIEVLILWIGYGSNREVNFVNASKHDVLPLTIKKNIRKAREYTKSNKIIVSWTNIKSRFSTFNKSHAVQSMVLSLIFEPYSILLMTKLNREGENPTHHLKRPLVYLPICSCRRVSTFLDLISAA